MRWHDWEPWFGLGLGIYLLVLGIQTQRGRWRKVVAASWVVSLWGAKNLPYAAIPAGVAVILITIGATVVDHAIATPFIILAVFAFLVTVAIMIRPPERLVPHWTKECGQDAATGWLIVRGSAGPKR
jgi:hypothetical protein